MNDAFGAAHRAHASTEGVARLVPDHVAGHLLEREVGTLMKVLEDPARPLVSVLGGAKVSDKIGVIDRFRETADTILIGGAMCFPFFAAQGHPVGDSLCAEDDVQLARRILDASGGAARAELKLPVDLVLGDRFAADANVRAIDGVDVPDGWMGLDIGQQTRDDYREVIAQRGDGVLERAHGRVRASAVRRGNLGGRACGRPGAGHDGRRWR